MTGLFGCQAGKGGTNLIIPPTVAFQGLKALQYSGVIPINLFIDSEQAIDVKLTLVYSTSAGGQFQPTTPEPGRGDPTAYQNLKVPAGGAMFVYWWHAIANLQQGVKHSNVYVKAIITLPDGTTILAVFGPMMIDLSDGFLGSDAPYVEGGAMPSSFCGAPYEQPLNVEGGTPPYEWKLLPPGTQLPWFLELTYDGNIVGDIPEDYGPNTIEFTARVLDSNPVLRRESAGAFSLFIDCVEIPTLCAPPPDILFTSMPLATEGEAYFFTCTADLGEDDLVWSIVDGTFPEDLELRPDGEITGTPSEGSAGIFTFTIQVCDSCPEGAQCDTQVINFQIIEPGSDCDPGPSIVSTSVAPAKEGIVYTALEPLLAAGGHGETLTWVIFDGALPTGLELSEDGFISGTPGPGTGGEGTGETYIFTVQVCDECDDPAPQCDTRELAIVVAPPDQPCAGPPEIQSTSPIDTASIGVEYTYNFLATGGEGGKTWLLNNPDVILDTGLIWSSTGLLSGTPLEGTAGDYDLDVTVNDSCPEVQSDTGIFTLTISDECAAGPVIATTEIPDAVEGVPYNFQFQATPGQGSLTWARLGTQVFPEGLIFSSNGVLSGTPVSGQAALSPFSDIEIQVTDSCDTGPQSSSNLFTMEVFESCEAGPTIETTSLPMGGIGTEYNAVLVASGGVGTLTWELVDTGDDLPADLIFSDGIISGIPAADTDGFYDLHFEVCDSCPSPQCDDTQLELEIGVGCAGPPEITTAAIDEATVGIPYTFQFEATGGEGTLLWSVEDPFSLPPSFELSTSGELASADPGVDDIGDWELIINVRDECFLGAQLDQVTLQLSVVLVGCLPAPSIDMLSPHQVPAGSAIHLEFKALNGQGALTWTLLDSTPPLPGTLSFGADGVLVGVTDISDFDVYQLDVQVCDECNDPAPQCDTLIDFELDIQEATGCGAGPPEIQDVTVPTPIADATPYSHAMTVTGGDGQLQWFGTGFPPAVNIDPDTGIISGVVSPFEAGNYTIYIWVVDECAPVPQADSEVYIWNIF